MMGYNSLGSYTNLIERANLTERGAGVTVPTHSLSVLIVLFELVLCTHTRNSSQEAMSKGQGFGGFGLGKMKELTEALKKAQQVQEGAKKLQEELEAMELPGEAGGGLVKIWLSGNQEPRRVEISPDALGEGADVLSDLVLAAMKDAYNVSTATMRERMEQLTGGLNIPGM